MNFWAKISLAVLATGGLVAVYIVDEKMSERKKEAEKVDLRVLNFDAPKVRKFALKNASGEFVFERDNATSDWKMTAPATQTKPDQDAVSGLLSSLESTTISMSLPATAKIAQGSESDKQPFGLDKPRVTMEVTLEDKSTKAVYVGADLSIGAKTGDKISSTSVYALNSARTAVLVAPSSLFTSLNKSLADLRSKSFADFKIADVKSFAIAAAEGQTIQVQKGDKDWNLVAPKQVLADGNNISTYLNRLDGFKADKITDKEMLNEARLKSLALNPPSATLELKGADGKVLQVIKMGKAKEAIYLTMPDGSVGTLDVSKWQELVPEVKFFRDRKVLRDVTIADVTSVRTGTGKIFVKEGSSWFAKVAPEAAAAVAAAPAAAPKGTPTVAPKTANSDVGSFVSDWEFLTADDVIDPPAAQKLADFGLDKPSNHFFFEYADAKKAAEEILVGNRVPKKEKFVYVKRANRDLVYVVDTNWLDTLAKFDGSNALATKK